ncbi:sensor histidine kinase [Paraburkholderia sacchari]|uniref:histidine kinase n=1 Tax=Paraburkholderia sacchari TaxID=159450 RepID=A0A8T6ZAC3_9BURK|nr:histidine kinase [Paraburkholderia sacchari]NLP61194.1 two-component sensor histidine kinase [Paraburkholderia sacchari]
MDTSNRAALDAGGPRADAPGARALRAAGGFPLLASAEGTRVTLDAIARVQERIAAASAARVDADEAARHRLARELHDSVGAELTATRFALANVHTWLPANTPPQCTEALALVMRSLNSATDAMRHVLDGLHAPELHAGLADALANWTRDFASRTGLAARFLTNSSANASANSTAALHSTGFTRDDEARLARLPAEAALAVFRVAQEALTNVARHAQATQVEVRLTSTPSELIVSVIDDGVGLSRKAARRAGRQCRQSAQAEQAAPTSRNAYGIAGMRERCAAFGGTLRTTPSRRAAACRLAADPARPGTTVEARFLWETLLTRPRAEPAADHLEGGRS